MKKYVDENGLIWLYIDSEVSNEEDLKTLLRNNIYKSFYNNVYYLVAFKNIAIITWIKQGGYIHVIKDKMHFSFNRKDELKYIDTLLSSEMKIVLEHVKEDNEFLYKDGLFNNLELLEF